MKFQNEFTQRKILRKMRNPGIKDFSLVSNDILKGIRIEENPSKNGIKDFSLISTEILKGIHIKENPSKNEKSRNEGFLFNF